MVVCDCCLEQFDEQDAFMGLCSDCFKIMYGTEKNVQPFMKKRRFDDEV